MDEKIQDNDDLVIELFDDSAKNKDEIEKIQPVQEEVSDEKPQNKKKSVIGDVFDAVDAVVVAMVVAFLVLTVIFRTGFVDGDSMNDTLLNNDKYIISGLFYTPAQGDIVVFQPGARWERNDKLWVKRVIAVAGQEIDIHDGYVYVDGERLNETYLNNTNNGKTAPLSPNVKFPLTVPEGHVFLMGDNRINSKDSRIIGVVDARRIVGKLLFRYFPFNSIGTVD